MDRVELFLFGTALLLIMCVIASKATGRLGIPTLVVFLGVGIFAGSEGVGGIHFDNVYYAQTLSIVALTYILFSGGLDTQWSSIRPVLKSGASLATLGVLTTSVLVGVFTYYTLGFSLLESLLIGAIISSTDAGAVFTVLRSRNINLRENLKPLLELESGSNDPMAVFLTTTILQIMLNERYAVGWVIPDLIQQMVLGAGIGFVAGKGIAWGFNRLKLEFEGLYTVMSLAVVLIIYTTSQSFNGNGFLSVYVAGVVLSNESFVFKKSLILLHDGVSWLMQSLMFLTLGLLLYPSRVFQVTGPGLLIALFLIFVARPLGVYLSLAFSSLKLKEKTFIAWVGLRGAVPVVLATYPLVAGIERADTIFNIIFFVAMMSLVLQGTTIKFVAKLLGLESAEPAKPSFQAEYTSTASTANNMFHIKVPKNSPAASKTIVDLKLPQDLLIVLIERGKEVIIPRGATQIEESDKLLVVAQKDSLQLLKDQLNEISDV